MDTTQAQSVRPALSSSLRTLNRRNVSATCGSTYSQALPKRRTSSAAKENSSRYEQAPFSPSLNNNLIRTPVSNLQFPRHPNDFENSSGKFATAFGANQEWRQGRSYRDTTSEIISLYAHQSTHLTGTPSLYEGSSRSKSFSTSSSRHTPSHKSFRTSSGQSDGGMQVSRSPAPYSQRWKQPILRPGSPIVVHGEDTDYAGTLNMQGYSQQVSTSPLGVILYSHRLANDAWTPCIPSAA